MTGLGIAWAAVVVLAFVFAASMLAAVVAAAIFAPALPRLGADPPSRWPRVSVVIPACNEAPGIAAAMATRLADDYPAVDFIVVDDRSTDETGAIADRLAAGDPRVKAVHVKDLPAGWLGKVHALHVGSQAARGEWLLFSDADVHLAPGALRRAVAHAESRHLDMLAVLPAVWPATPAVDVPATHFLRMFVAALALASKVRDPRSGIGAGCGAFNLVRRSALATSPGFASIRLEVADDLALGQVIKRSGHRCDVALGGSDVGVRLYESVGGMLRGLDRAAVSVMGAFSPARTAAIALALALLDLAPFLGPFLPSALWVRVVAAAGAACALAGAAAANLALHRPLWPALLLPVASVFALFAHLRSAALAWARDGVAWRTTVYPLRMMREARRRRDAASLS